jgi:tRNA-dihydrouridine synthase A
MQQCSAHTRRAHSEHGPDAFSVAPMMNVTDRHFRYMFRLLSGSATLWTEMIVSNALVHNALNTDRWLEFKQPAPGPVVLQLGGNNAESLGTAVQLAHQSGFGYSAVNLNCGCPSTTVAEKGQFGAALMLDPESVKRNCAAMLEGGKGELPVTVKCRLGVDDAEHAGMPRLSLEEELTPRAQEAELAVLSDFVSQVSAVGVDHFVIHARRGVLGGLLNTDQNRNVPPLKYEQVYRLKAAFPHLQFSINGGITSMDEAAAHLERGINGVMVGRAAQKRPWEWSKVDGYLAGRGGGGGEGGGAVGSCRASILEKYIEYGEQEMEANSRVSMRALIRPLYSLFHGEAGGARFRFRMEEGMKAGHGFGRVVMDAAGVIEGNALQQLPQQNITKE